MKRAFPFIVALLALLGMLVAAPTVQAAPSPFTGLWISTDLDGSTQHLMVSGGTDVHVTYVDDFGTVCVNAGASSTVFRGSSTGTVSGNTLTATFVSARCGDTWLSGTVGTTWVWTYDPSTDTIFDGVVTWHRP